MDFDTQSDPNATIGAREFEASSANTVPLTTEVLAQPSESPTSLTSHYAQSVFMRYVIWVPVVYVLLHFCINPTTEYNLYDVLDPNFLLPLGFISVLAIMIHHMRNDVHVHRGKLEEICRALIDSQEQLMSPSRTLTAATRLTEVNPANRENVEKQIEKGAKLIEEEVKKLRDSVKTIAALQSDKRELQTELSASLQQRDDAHRLHRKRINDTRIAHYSSLLQQHVSIIKFIEYLSMRDDQVVAQVELTRGLDIDSFPALKLPFGQLYDTRTRIGNRLSIVQSIGVILDFATLTAEEVDAIVGEAEVDMERAVGVNGYLVIANEMAVPPVVGTVNVVLEERLKVHRERLDIHCEYLCDGSEGEDEDYEESSVENSDVSD
jgi:hypothetical protein